MGREIELPETTKAVIEDGLVMLATEEEEQAEVDQPTAPEAPATQAAEPDESNEEPEKKEETGRKDPTWVTEYPTAHFELGKPMLAHGTYRMPSYIKELIRGVRVGTLNQPLEHSFLRYEHDGYDLKGLETRYEELMPLAWPMTEAHSRLSRAGSIWTNDVVAEGLSTKPVGVRPKGDDVVDIFTSQNSLGQSTEWTFYNTGIKIRVRPCLDSELVNLERLVSIDRAMVGQETWGAYLGTDMGIHMNHLIDFALGLVTWTNLEHEGDMRVALRQRLRGRESINVLLAAVLASMYPQGYPWTVHCHAGECRATELIDVFFARAQVTDKSILTEKHLNILHRNSKVLTEERYIEYLEDLPNATEDIEYNGTVFKLRLPSIADYAHATRRWVQAIEIDNASALEKFDVPAQRESYLEAQAASRTLLTISHYIGSVTITSGDSVSEVTDRDRIERILHAGSGDMQLVATLTAAVTNFEVESTNTFIGHNNMQCPTCGANVRDQSGPWSSLVILPVERIFFMLTQLKIQILRGVRERL